MSMPPDVGAALSSLIYDLADTSYPGTGLSLQEILDSNVKLTHRAELEKIVEQYNLENVLLVDSSWNHTDSSGDKLYGTMNAATFKFQPNGETYIAYRGTGADNWLYNADSAFGDHPSQMQEWARAYCDQTLTNYYIPGNELYVTGHSQGGNNALYALLTSEYAEYITGCVSVDGPGFSQDVIDQIIREKGQDFLNEQIEKCMGIYGENDYVHRLGEVHLIPQDQRIVVTTPEANDFAGYHDIFTHFGNGKLNYEVDEDGNIIKVNPGPVSVMVSKINDSLLEHLSEEDRYICGQAVMAIIEVMIGNGKISNLSDFSDFVTLLEKGLPMLVLAIIKNPEDAMNLLNELAPDLLEWIQRHPVVSVVLTALLTTVGVTLLIGADIILRMVDFVTELVNKVKDIAAKVYDSIMNTIQSIKKAFSEVVEYLRNLTPGARYVKDNPAFRADTGLMREYANRLRAVNSLLTSLDRDLDDLYWQVGLLDVYDILCANIIAGYSPRIGLCRRYLNSAADALENADRKASGYMGG